MINTKLSSFSSNKAELKDLVISVLSREEGLNAKNIYSAIRSDHASNTTYQGVHKALRLLKDQGILLEDTRRYSLNPKWITDLNAFVNKVEAKRSGKAALDFGEIKNDSSVTMTFDSYMDALYALLDNMDRSALIKPDPDISIAHMGHAWPVTCVSKKEFDQLHRVMSIGERAALVNSATNLDKVFSDFWESLGAKMRIGVPCATHCDLLVTNDMVVQVFLSSPVRTGLEEVFKNSNKNELNFANLYSTVFGLKGNVKVIITQNKELADQIREETLKYFK